MASHTLIELPLNQPKPIEEMIILETVNTEQIAVPLTVFKLRFLSHVIFLALGEPSTE